MSSDEYVRSIISKYKVNSVIDSYTQTQVIDPLSEIIKGWAGYSLIDVKVSGSRAKGTAINLGSDIDLFISLISTTDYSLKQIYDSLYDCMLNRNITCRKQNVSVGINYKNHNLDLVPGKRHNGNTNDHSLYKNKSNTWTQTNVERHINLVKNSGRIEEIILLKIWRKLNNLDFPSIYLELIVIEALTNKNKNHPADNFWTVLEYLGDSFVDKKVIDPANSNNIISDDLFKYEREAIAYKAKESSNKRTWNEIIW